MNWFSFLLYKLLRCACSTAPCFPVVQITGSGRVHFNSASDVWTDWVTGLNLWVPQCALEFGDQAVKRCCYATKEKAIEVARKEEINPIDIRVLLRWKKVHIPWDLQRNWSMQCSPSVFETVRMLPERSSFVDLSWHILSPHTTKAEPY